MRILGIDCGRVIIDPVIGSVPDALEAVRAIARSGQFEKIYIVSRVNMVGRVYFPPVFVF